MAYVSVSEWRPEQVTEWLKGLDVCVTPYLHWFSNNEVNGQQLLNLNPDDLTHLGVHKIGHQELILEAVEHLRNFHYELDRENLQLLALRVSCAAHSLYNEIKHKPETTSVPTQTMADVSNAINQVKPLVSWLDRPPFAGQIEYSEYKTQLLRISLEMATYAQRDTFAERPISEIRNCSSKLAKLADSIIQDIKDPMILQPASLDLATIKKRVGEDLGFFLIPSFHGIHQISDMKLSSPAHQSGKIQPGDEIVQVNYQTVVGWSRKKVLALFDESPNDLLLTLKRRPRHVKMYGQIYMKPYRLPSRKRDLPYSRWNENVASPRPELLTLPKFEIPSRITINTEKTKKSEDILSEPSSSSSSSDEEFGRTSDSQNSVSLRLYLPKPRAPIQRRFTLSGPPRPSAQSEQFWRELQLERSWRSNQSNSQINNSNSEKQGKEQSNVDDMFQLRDKSASLGNSIATTSPVRPSTCITIAKTKIGTVKFDLPKSEPTNGSSSDKVIAEERDKGNCDKDAKSSSVESSVEKSSQMDSSGMSQTGKMSISELNKIKRDAFFNNMDGGNGGSKSGVEDSSEKVKRIIENFKSEVSNIKMEIPELEIVHTPGKVSQLIGSFERKELKPEEGRSGLRRKKQEESEKENHGQMVNTINDCLLPDRDDYSNEEDEISNGSDFDYRSRGEVREIVDTVNLALVELKQRQDHYDAREKQKEDEDRKVVKKPVPLQRKSKIQPEAPAEEAPPVPRPRMSDRAPEPRKTPPEPPPRPESTFPKALRRSDDPDGRKAPPASGSTGNLPQISEVSNRSYEVRQPKEGSPRTPVLNVVTEKPKSSGSTLENLKAMLSLGKKPLNFSSPRSVRKKNALLARKRNVSVKEVSPGDNSGLLWHRNRKGSTIAPWSKFYFVLQGPNFYGFKSKDSQKADLFIHLPGFTCTLAEEVKSKDFAFKIYHTGTAFYFAANSREDLQQWLDCVSVATICPDEKQVPESVTFSVSDSDSSDAEFETETCFPTSPKMKKFLGSSPVPKPARSHQNLSTDSKKTYDVQKRFGSLKKLSSQKHSSNSNTQNTEIASLDRKYLRFLGHKNTPTPVPTSQFRSYRRMQPSTSTSSHGKSTEKSEQTKNSEAGLVRKTLHLSNPSLIHPDMADYRITQERLAEFRRLRNQEMGQEPAGFMTLEQFMMSRQEEDALMRANRQRPPELRGLMTLEQFLLRQEEERQLSHRPNPFRDAEPEGEGRRNNLQKMTRPSGPRPEPVSREKPQVAPRKYNLTKINNIGRPDLVLPSTSGETEEAFGVCGTLKSGLPKNSSEEDEPPLPHCSHLSKDPTPDYPGIEYPPAFEPETYTLQYMLKNRRKRNANKHDPR